MPMFDCRFCRKRREDVNGLCGGCGSEVRLAGVKPPQRDINTPASCPKCGRRGVPQDDHRWVCISCNSWFERDDQTYVDDRPDVNAEKQEAFRERQAKHAKCKRHQTRGAAQ